MIRPWPLLASEAVFDAGIFRVTKDRVRSPRTGGELDFHLRHMADWLLVVPLNIDGKLILVRQYRHGTQEVSLEVPGGLHDQADESPAKGAVREVTEETGYGCSSDSTIPVLLGELRPQPALLSNRAWVYLAKGLRPVTGQNLDAGEDIEVVLLDPQEIPKRIANGEINNAMTVAALSLAQLGDHLDPGKCWRSSEKENVS